MISASDRENAVLLINEAIASGASCKKACWTVWIGEYPKVCVNLQTDVR